MFSWCEINPLPLGVDPFSEGRENNLMQLPPTRKRIRYPLQLGHIKREGNFEHVQNVLIHLNPRMRKFSSGPLLIQSVVFQWFWQWTAKALIRLWIRSVWFGLSPSAKAPKVHFSWGDSFYNYSPFLRLALVLSQKSSRRKQIALV